MGYYEFPHTRNYDSDLGFLIKKYKELGDDYNTLVDIYKIVKQNIKDITLEQLQEWLEDGTLEMLVQNVISYYGQGYVYPETFGAKGDGVTDDTVAFENALAYIDENINKVLYIQPNKTYLLSRPLLLKPYYKIEGYRNADEYGNASIMKNVTTDFFTCEQGLTDVRIEGITFISNGNYLIRGNTNGFRYLSKIKNCGFDNFSYIFDISFLGCNLEDLSINRCKGIGRLKGSDNYIRNIFISGISTENYDGLMFSQLSTTVIDHLFLTGVVEGNVGAENLIIIESGRCNTWRNLYLDYPVKNCILVRNNVDNTRCHIFDGIFVRGFGEFGIKFEGTSRNFILTNLCLYSSHIPDIKPDNVNLLYIPTTTYYTQVDKITSQLSNYSIDNNSSTSYINNLYRHENTAYKEYIINNLPVYSKEINMQDKQTIQFDFDIGDISAVKLENSAIVRGDIINGSTRLDLHVVVTSVRGYHIRGYIINLSGGVVNIPTTARYNFTIYGYRNDDFITS